MTTKKIVVTIPISVRDIDACNSYFLMIKDELYRNFVEFWTQHQRFSKTCHSHTCSRVFIVDSHQKANRLVCQFKNVFDCTVSEMGSVQVGCLYSPLRKGNLLNINPLNSCMSMLSAHSQWRWSQILPTSSPIVSAISYQSCHSIAAESWRKERRKFRQASFSGICRSARSLWW